MARVPVKNKPINPNPPRQFTELERQRVWGAAAAGMSQTNIARMMRCDEKTLRKYCSDVLESASDEAIVNVATSLYNRAVNGEGREAVAAAIFWLKTRARWRDVADAPAQGNVTVVLKKFEDALDASE